MNTDFTLKQLNEGVFVTSGKEPNPMTIGWGLVGRMWSRPVFIAPVRDSRFTYQKIKESGYFTVSVPETGKMKKALGFCGSKSGRDTDKWAGAGIAAAPAKSVPSYIVADCKRYYECRVLAEIPVLSEMMEPSLLNEWYRENQGGLHTFFAGEIIAEYGDL